MSSAEQKTVFQDDDLTSLLEAIDQKTGPALLYDLEALRQRSSQGATGRTLYISFVIGWHEMALPVATLHALGDMPVITPLPYLPSWIRGIVQIRGEIMSVVDFQRLFHLREERRTLLKQSFVFFQHDDLQFCLHANRITGILNVDEQNDHLEPCSAEEKTGCAEMLEFVRGVLVRNRRRIFILDSDAIGHAEIIRHWHQ